MDNYSFRRNSRWGHLPNRYPYLRGVDALDFFHIKGIGVKFDAFIPIKNVQLLL